MLIEWQHVQHVSSTIKAEIHKDLISKDFSAVAVHTPVHNSRGAEFYPATVMQIARNHTQSCDCGEEVPCHVETVSSPYLTLAEVVFFR